MTPFEAKAAAAISHLIHRVQTDPDFYYLCSPGTQSFDLLCEAEAERKQVPVEKVRAAAALDLQPPYRWRPPDVEVLKNKADILRHYIDDIGDGGLINRDAGEQLDREHDEWLHKRTQDGKANQQKRLDAYNVRAKS